MAPSAATAAGDTHELSAGGRPWWLELGTVVPRSLAFSVRASRQGEADGIPPLQASPLAWATVAVDELTLSAAYLLRRRSSQTVTDDVQLTAAESVARLDRAGVLADPGLLYPQPAAPDDLRRSRRSRTGTAFEHLSFPSTWTPPVPLEVDQAWSDPGGNGRVHAYLIRHGDRPRPWLVMLHGHLMGEPRDLRLLGSLRLQADLGVDIAHLVLPMHGPRSRGTGHPFPGLDPTLNLVGMAQAVHDARALLALLRQESDTPVGVYGISLGGHVAGLLAGFEPDLGCVIAGVPTTDTSTMLADTMRGHWGEETVETSHVMDPAPRMLSRLVSPLAYPAVVPHDRLFVYGAVGDRLVTPQQALALWQHWDRPEIHWLQGGHIANNIRSARRFICAALQRNGIAASDGMGN